MKTRKNKIVLTKFYNNYEELAEAYYFLPKNYNEILKSKNKTGVINHILKYGINHSFDENYNVDCNNCNNCVECVLCTACNGCVFCRYCNGCIDCHHTQDKTNLNGYNKKTYYELKKT